MWLYARLKERGRQEPRQPRPRTPEADDVEAGEDGPG